MDERRSTNLTHMQATGKDIAAIFAQSIEPAHVSSMSEALIAMSQSAASHESRLMILGALAALGHGAMAPLSIQQGGGK